MPTPTPAAIDITAPETRIDDGPAAQGTDPAPSFRFSATELGATFECSVDDGVFAACASPHTIAAQPPGRHRFRVRASDAAGNVDDTPAAHDFLVPEGPPAGADPQPAPTATATPDPAVAPPPAVDPPDEVPPRLQRLVLGARALEPARTGPSLVASRGLPVSFRLDGPATVTIRVERVVRGRASRGKCRVHGSGRSTVGRPCTLIRKVPGSVGFSAKRGVNRLRFSGRIGSRALVPGRHRLRLTATDAAGNAADTFSEAFAVRSG